MVEPVAVRLRRDFGAILALIRAHAILHQLNRPKDSDRRIIATLDDYEVVRDLVAGIVSEGVGATVSMTVRDTVDAVAALADSHPDGVTATALAEKMGLDKSAARRRLLMAKRDNYLENREERRGHPGRWAIGEPLPDEVELLPPRHRLADKTTGQPSGGTVARTSEGVKGDCLELAKAAFPDAEPASPQGDLEMLDLSEEERFAEEWNDYIIERARNEEDN
jgi:hypothetical protein